MLPANIYDIHATEEIRRRHRMDRQIVREFRTSAFKRFQSTEQLQASFPEFAIEQIDSLDIAQRCDSRLDGATKLLFRTRAGMLIESVILRIATGRVSLCVSSQVGCAANCDFCATGKMGIAQSLASQEILDQVRIVGQILAEEGQRIRNIVFMGMGEPFHNEDNLLETIETLTSPQFFNFSPARILVSTVGIPDGIVRCAERFPAVNLALSLHSVCPDIRERIIPLSRIHSLATLREAIQEANRIQQKPVMIEYLMLSGLNDSIDDANHLVEWLTGLDVHVNLIPFNPIQDAPHLQGSEELTIRRFAQAVKDGGFQATVRYSLGADIAAACGQLVRQENRRLAREQAVVD